MNASKRHKILLLGGTTEAREIADVLAKCTESDAMISLAGRTSIHAKFQIPVRIGGFGGAEGLAVFLRENAFDLLINATHPYADQMWRNAIDAARLADVPLVAFHRPPWTPTMGDRWTQVDGVAGAIATLGRRKARNVFLPLGHKELVKFEAVPRHRYLIRAIETFDPPLKLPKASYIKARPALDDARFGRADDHAGRHVGRLSGSASRAASPSIFSSGRPAARPKMTGVSVGQDSRSVSKARPSCQGRALLIGL
jgi:precorrin-6A/cobalt-precorrin-6A reductase